MQYRLPPFCCHAARQHWAICLTWPAAAGSPTALLSHGPPGVPATAAAAWWAAGWRSACPAAVWAMAPGAAHLLPTVQTATAGTVETLWLAATIGTLPGEAELTPASSAAQEQWLASVDMAKLAGLWGRWVAVGRVRQALYPEDCSVQ